MFRFNKKKTMAFCMATLLGIQGWMLPVSNPISSVAEVSAANLEDYGLCTEDEYFLIGTGDGYADIYDIDGTLMGRCRTWSEMGYMAGTVNKTDVLSFCSDKAWYVYSMKKLENILELPRDDYEISTYKDISLVTDRVNGTLQLYDNCGELLYTLEDDWVKEPDGYYSAYEVAGGFLLIYYYYGETPSEETEKDPASAPLLWVSHDGGDVKRITDPELISRLQSRGVIPFGEYLVVFDWMTTTGEVYDLDGNILMDGIVDYIYDYGPETQTFTYYEETVLVQKPDEDGTTCTIYNSSFEPIGQVPYDRDQYCRCSNGYLTGAAYPELDGMTCTDFAGYKNGMKNVPYTSVDGGFLVYTGSETLFIPAKNGSSLYQLNDAFALVSEYEEEQDLWAEKIIDIQTGEVVVASDNTNSDRWCYLSLLEDGYLISENCYNEEEDSYSSSYSVYDFSGQCLYEEQGSGYCNSWKGNTLFVTRGIYVGITDLSGNWILRSIGNWKE